MRRVNEILIGACLATSLVLVGCGGEDEGWEVRRFKSSDATHQAVRSELIGPCKTTHVVDGDTLDVKCRSFSDQVRMLRIDTPESGQSGSKEARAALAGLVEGREIHLLFEERGVRQRGNYGRLLAYVYQGETNVNVEMVRLGWSRFWTDFGEGRFADPFREAEAQASGAKRGLWAEQ